MPRPRASADGAGAPAAAAAQGRRAVPAGPVTGMRRGRSGSGGSPTSGRPRRLGSSWSCRSSTGSGS
eukprot:935328-Alexandrium_andersonii.AAC.1